MRLTLVLMCWNTSHLLARTLQTLQRQTFKDEWELIIVDDNSEDDVQLVLRENGSGLPIKYHRLEHDMGMRGNTFSINYGISQAEGEVLMWSTPEVMLPPDTLKRAYETQQTGELLFVTTPSHGLTQELQLQIDTVDWRSDIHAIKELVEPYPPEHWNSRWFYANFYKDGRRDGEKRMAYGNNQTVAVRKDRWMETIKEFPMFLDYGSDDPWLCDARRKHGFRDVTLWDQEAYHQWHTTSQYWIAMGKAPNWNKYGHTTSNLMDDTEVPDNGTCGIWDGGDTSQFTEEEKREVLQLHNAVIATGYRRKEDG